MPKTSAVKSAFRGVFKERTLMGTIEGFVTLPLYLLALLAYLPLGYKFSMVNFTYGAKGLDPAAKATLPVSFLALLALMFVWEVFFRGLVLRSALKYFSWQKAFWVHALVLNAVILPLLWKPAAQWQTFGFLRFFLGENLFEGFLALFLLRTGSLLACTVLHACYNVVRFVIINDVTGPFDTFYFYSAAADDFYWLILALGLLLVSFEVLILQTLGPREKGSEP